MTLQTVRAALLGLGSVHQTLLQILDSKREVLASDYGLVFQIVAATDRSGIVVDSQGQGLDTRQLVAHKKAGGKLSEWKDYYQGSGRETVRQVLEELDLDILFEATPCSVGDPHQPQDTVDDEALTIVRDSLTRGVSVVLANKGPLVQALRELRELSQKPKSGRLEFSATVCGGLPILNIGRRDMVADSITKVQGVFNATSNFVLESLAEGGRWEDAIREAQRVGAAEADPRLDTDGWDTAFKLLIIVNTIMMGSDTTKYIQLEDISVQGIQDVTPDRIGNEAERGNVIKLVATAENGHYSVQPLAHAKDRFLGSITGWEMGVELHSDIYGISYHKLYEKEPIPTAASMLRDAINIFRALSR